MNLLLYLASCKGQFWGRSCFNIYIIDLSNIISCNNLFSNALELFVKERLQANLCVVEKWCSENCMMINIYKCLRITYHRTHSPIKFNYTLSIAPLKSVADILLSIPRLLFHGMFMSTLCAI